MLYRALDLEKSGGVTIDLAKFFPKLAQGAMQVGRSFLPGGAALSKLVEELQKAGTQNLSETAFDAIQRERTKIHIEQVRFLEQFQGQFALLVNDRIEKQHGRLVVFVDDLDRCLPEKAIEVLEAIKLFVDAPGCVFMLGLDQEVIARGVEIRYKDFEQKDGRNQISGAKYLEKIIQLPFQTPPVEQADMGDFVQGLTTDWPNEECPKVFAVGLGDNPRQIKRTVNVFLMLWKLAEKREKKLQGRIKPIRLAKVVAIQTIYPELYSLLKETPRYLRELEEFYRTDLISPSSESPSPSPESLSPSPESPSPSPESPFPSPESPSPSPESPSPTGSPKGVLREGVSGEGKTEPPPALAAYVSRQAVLKILTMHPPELPDANFAGLTPDELRLYFTLTRRAEAPQAASAEPARQSFEPQMVHIPAGKFLMGITWEQMKKVFREAGRDWEKRVQNEMHQHTVELSEYSIGKYPVTNREYQVFVKETSYKPPQRWDDNQYPPEKGDHPVVNVSWEDANAYCKWLSEKTKKPYRLPTEAEWEKAARGDKEARVYPWGNDFDPKKANTAETGIGDTTPVGQFSPQSDSPYGCADMVGNVWEWCSDWFKGEEYNNRNGGIKNPQGVAGLRKAVRGGSWDFDGYLSNVSIRGSTVPSYRYNNLGFRLAAFPSG
jgi:formylglycine-generating enzyme required for sulfatase activity